MTLRRVSSAGNVCQFVRNPWQPPFIGNYESAPYFVSVVAVAGVWLNDSTNYSYPNLEIYLRY